MQAVANRQLLVHWYDGHINALRWKSAEAWLPTNSKANCKFHAVKRGREEAIVKSQPDEQKLDTKAQQADELTKSNEVQKVTVTLLRKSSR